MMAHNEVYLRCAQLANASRVLGNLGANILSKITLKSGVYYFFCLEGVSQMVYILPERLLTLVRPAFDLVLRRVRSLKRCVEA